MQGPVLDKPVSKASPHLKATASRCCASARSSCCRLSAASSMAGEGAGGPDAAASAACCSGANPSSQPAVKAAALRLQAGQGKLSRQKVSRD